jgi:hypothetical protein
MPVYEHMYSVGSNVYKPKANQVMAGGHAIEVVGWGTEDNGEGYWIMKNSWGCNWGDSGFFKQGWGYNGESYFMGLKMNGNSAFQNDVNQNEQPQCQIPEDGDNADNCAQYNEFGDCKLCNSNYVLQEDATCQLDGEIENNGDVQEDDQDNEPSYEDMYCTRHQGVQMSK